MYRHSFVWRTGLHTQFPPVLFGNEGWMIKLDEELLSAARAASTSAYAPYSGVPAGAAVRAEGAIFKGCTVENESFSVNICAERVAIFTAVAAGARRIEALAVANPNASDKIRNLVPCGACLQVMKELGGMDLVIHVDRARSYTLGELLPQLLP